jgi:hypothetical protein
MYQQELAYQDEVIAISYETEANVLQGTYDALNATLKLFLGDVRGSVSSVAHLGGDALHAMGAEDASTVMDTTADIYDVAHFVSGIPDAIRSSWAAFSSVKGVGGIKSVNWGNILRSDAQSAGGQIWLNVTTFPKKVHDGIQSVRSVWEDFTQ